MGGYVTVTHLKPKPHSIEAEMAIIQLGVVTDAIERLPRDALTNVALTDTRGDPMTGQMCLCAIVLRLSQVLSDIDHKRQKRWFGL
jgi:hypothetical protein